ncbi:hypothetical protein Dthio_PD3476 [Desulfonatronospira thiodismutans ASO3-1]|uniref:Uncharacterized protein n=1 Tax=Desulfonatronospira thiodismutans ASO3-1 TaxID=555779 RepID=D6SMX3_9BACT|nr:hypothetical protein Dthio_PD3476 [Desulfonatronospira thiodismutans ASO3-1]
MDIPVLCILEHNPHKHRLALNHGIQTVKRVPTFNMCLDRFGVVSKACVIKIVKIFFLVQEGNLGVIVTPGMHQAFTGFLQQGIPVLFLGDELVDISYGLQN